jgi:hypothetical protein
MPVVIPPPEMSRRDFWKQFLSDLRTNLGVGRDVFAALAIWWLISSILLFFFEGHGFFHSLYTTWTTMATIGPLDGAPVTRLGKLLVSIDAFAALTLFGGMVWLVATSLSRR